MSSTTTFELTLGLTIPSPDANQPESFIEPDAFDLFLVQEASPLLRSFRITESLGFWQGEPEPCVVLTYISAPDEDTDQAYLKLHAIATAFKARFSQQAVLISEYNSISVLV